MNVAIHLCCTTRICLNQDLYADLHCQKLYQNKQKQRVYTRKSEIAKTFENYVVTNLMFRLNKLEKI